MSWNGAQQPTVDCSHRYSRESLESMQADLYADDVNLSEAIIERLQGLPLDLVERFFLDGGVMPPPPPPPIPPTGAAYTPPSVCFAQCSTEELAAAMSLAGAHGGVLEIIGLPASPFSDIECIFDDLHGATQDGRKIDAAYPPGLVLKDALKAGGSAAASADMKRVLDLNPDRISAAEAAFASLAAAAVDAPEPAARKAFGAVIRFWRACCDEVAPKLTAAVARAAGSADVKHDTHYDFRMVDYYEREIEREREQATEGGRPHEGVEQTDGRPPPPTPIRTAVETAVAAPPSSVRPPLPPRCRAHRDFGSFTLVFCEQPGLQVQLGSGAGGTASEEGSWRDVRPSGPGSALLLFGWCTQVRSNGRLHAALHRVVDGPPCAVLDERSARRSARRTSAVFFISPTDMQAPLEPVVLPGEPRQFVNGVSPEAQMMYSQNPLARAKMLGTS